MERRLAVLTRAPRPELTARSALVAVVLASLVSTSALAAPKRKAAKQAFDKGVALYTKQDYEGARAALAASAKLETDVETLFALAQTERQLGHCERAIELYEQLLDLPMPAANKRAIRPKIDECKQQLAAQPPSPPEAPAPEPAPASASAPAPAPIPASAPSAAARTPSRPSPHLVGGSLLGLGAVGLAVGSYYLYAGRQTDLAARAATNYFEYARLRDHADSQGTTGVIAASVGGALAIGGIIWYATRSSRAREEPALTGWLGPGGGGLVTSGRF